jgi:hypothetical protein
MLSCSSAKAERFAPRGGVVLPATGRRHDLSAIEWKQMLGRWRD